MDGTDGITIALGATTTGFLVKELMAWLRSRNQRTEIAPDPLHAVTEKKPTFVSVGECNRRMCEHDQRLAKLDDEIKRSNAAVMQKLDDIDTRAENRSAATHQRLDPLVEEIGRVKGKMDYIEKAALAATIGGKK